ncbi:neuronal acetylcholine receptor subunit alpha-6-like [Acanthaster planci]|uniref:Neuronal acetylcholine receptor subunit alpha-6-like n=1 Tax=Acanthaster planci TaxID=133434 RepID=A0A8B7XEP2_ACAPL|nr:neuronal acetylcholine receptor subunit alpha-6-like [Acanthaster planci]
MASQQFIWSLLLYALVVFVDAEASITTNDSSIFLAERRLRHVLFRSDEYDAHERPVLLSHQPVDVNVSLAMYALISLDEKEQIMTGASWFIMQWHDYRIRWDPQKYGNLRYLSLAMDEIWTPKLLLTNTASEKVENPVQESIFRALLSWDGHVTLEGPIIHITSCRMQLSEFPFDRQNCSLVFSTQNMPMPIVNLRLGPEVRIDATETTSQWRTLTLRGEAHSQTFKYLTYPKVLFSLEVERLPYHYLLNIALPSAVITLISLGVFWLTPESGEKISMAVSLLLGQAVFWLVVADSLPATGCQDTPLLLVCIECNFVVSGLAILLSVVTLGVHHRPGPLRSRFLRGLLLCTLPQLVCLRCKRRRKVGDLHGETAEQVKDAVETVKTVNMFAKEGEKPIEDFKLSSDALESQNGMDDMKLVAAVLDRIFFVIAAIVFICGNAPLFCKWIQVETALDF